MEPSESKLKSDAIQHPKSPAFLTPTAGGISARASSTCPKCCGRRSEGITRRSALKRCFVGAASIVLSGWGVNSRGEAANAADTGNQAPAEESAEESACRNCSGSGKIPCELCSGTGFWRALSGSDPKQRYKGVVCPECEGLGSLPCPVCLGTGEGNVRGLLRRRKIEPGPGRVLQS